MADKPDAQDSIDSYLAGVSDAKADNPGTSSNSAVDKDALVSLFQVRKIPGIIVYFFGTEFVRRNQVHFFL